MAGGVGNISLPGAGMLEAAQLPVQQQALAQQSSDIIRSNQLRAALAPIFADNTMPIDKKLELATGIYGKYDALKGMELLQQRGEQEQKQTLAVSTAKLGFANNMLEKAYGTGNQATVDSTVDSINTMFKDDPIFGSFLGGLGKPVVGGTEGLNAADIYGKDADGRVFKRTFDKKTHQLGPKEYPKDTELYREEQRGNNMWLVPQDMLPKGLLSEKPAGYKKEGDKDGDTTEIPLITYGPKGTPILTKEQRGIFLKLDPTKETGYSKDTKDALTKFDLVQKYISKEKMSDVDAGAAQYALARILSGGGVLTENDYQNASPVIQGFRDAVNKAEKFVRGRMSEDARKSIQAFLDKTKPVYVKRLNDVVIAKSTAFSVATNMSEEDALKVYDRFLVKVPIEKAVPEGTPIVGRASFNGKPIGRDDFLRIVKDPSGNKGKPITDASGVIWVSDGRKWAQSGK